MSELIPPGDDPTYNSEPRYVYVGMGLPLCLVTLYSVHFYVRAGRMFGRSGLLDGFSFPERYLDLCHRSVALEVVGPTMPSIVNVGGTNTDLVAGKDPQGYPAHLHRGCLRVYVPDVVLPKAYAYLIDITNLANVPPEGLAVDHLGIYNVKHLSNLLKAFTTGEPSKVSSPLKAIVATKSIERVYLDFHPSVPSNSFIVVVSNDKTCCHVKIGGVAEYSMCFSRFYRDRPGEDLLVNLGTKSLNEAFLTMSWPMYLDHKAITQAAARTPLSELNTNVAWGIGAELLRLFKSRQLRVVVVPRHEVLELDEESFEPISMTQEEQEELGAIASARGLGDEDEWAPRSGSLASICTGEEGGVPLLPEEQDENDTEYRYPADDGGDSA